MYEGKTLTHSLKTMKARLVIGASLAVLTGFVVIAGSPNKTKRDNTLSKFLQTSVLKNATQSHKTDPCKAHYDFRMKNPHIMITPGREWMEKCLKIYTYDKDMFEYKF